MSRVAKPINCKEEDVNILKSIVNNPLSAEILRLKARAILLANAGKESKTIALELGTREMSVGQWRKRYLQSGIKGLYGAERPGRRGSKSPNVRKMIAEEVKSRNRSEWTVESLAEEFKTSTDTVRRALTDANIEFPRSHDRKIQTEPLSDTRTVSVVGLYLSNTEKALILKSDSASASATDTGSISTKSIKNVKAIEAGSDNDKPVKVVSALKALAENGITEFNGRIINVSEFVNGLSATLCKSQESKIHIIIQRENKERQMNLRYPNISTSIVHDSSSWIESIRNWLRPLSSDAEEIIDAMETYIARGLEGREPFIWMSEPRKVTEVSQKTSGTTEESEAYANNRMVVNVKFETRDGIEKDYSFTFNDIFPSLSEISYETPLSFASSLGRVERETSSAFNDVTRTVVQNFMNEANKKKHYATQ